MVKQRFVKQASDDNDKEKNVYLRNKRYTNIFSIILKRFQRYSFAGL